MESSSLQMGGNDKEMPKFGNKLKTMNIRVGRINGDARRHFLLIWASSKWNRPNNHNK